MIRRAAEIVLANFRVKSSGLGDSNPSRAPDFAEFDAAPFEEVAMLKLSQQSRSIGGLISKKFSVGLALYSKQLKAVQKFSIGDISVARACRAWPERRVLGIARTSFRCCAGGLSGTCRTGSALHLDEAGLLKVTAGRNRSFHRRSVVRGTTIVCRSCSIFNHRVPEERESAKFS